MRFPPGASRPEEPSASLRLKFAKVRSHDRRTRALPSCTCARGHEIAWLVAALYHLGGWPRGRGPRTRASIVPATPRDRRRRPMSIEDPATLRNGPPNSAAIGKYRLIAEL